MDFKKKFNVGLCLNTKLDEFSRFLDDYHEYIEEIYFSLPLGNKFQTRFVIAKQFQSEKTVRMFWELLPIIRSHGIKLELVLNSYELGAEDVLRARETLDSHEIKCDSVCCLDSYYPAVRESFPDASLICSYNTGIRTMDKLRGISNEYDAFVIGNALIREREAPEYIRSIGKKTILLINNGCSFNCTWCRNKHECKETFDKNLKEHSAEYLYAKQSILPCELRNGTIDPELYDMFKISTRSSDVRYLRHCIDSYISNNAASYLKRSKRNLGLWGRLGHFWPRFYFMNTKKILEYKKEITGNDAEY